MNAMVWHRMVRLALFLGTVGSAACGSDGADAHPTSVTATSGADAGTFADGGAVAQEDAEAADTAAADDVGDGGEADVGGADVTASVDAGGVDAGASVDADAAAAMDAGVDTSGADAAGATVDAAVQDTADAQATAGNKDSDGDGLSDSAEDKNGNGQVDAGETDPTKADSDGDGLSDGAEDKNGNGKVDAGETDPTKADSDGDGLSDGAEAWVYGTDPTKPDTDGDGLGDGLEVGKAGDADAGSVTNPNAADTDGDGVPDGKEDANKNGKFDDDESDPNGIASTQPPCAGKADGTPCAAGKACVAGSCAPYKAPTGCAAVNCDDGNACTKDVCDNGTCSHSPQAGACAGGQCQAGKCAPEVCAAGKDWLYVPAGKAWMPLVKLDYVTLKWGDTYASALPPNADGWQVATATGEVAQPGETCKPTSGSSTCPAYLISGGSYDLPAFAITAMPVRVQDFRECAKTGACAYVDSWVTAKLTAFGNCSGSAQIIATALQSLAVNGYFSNLSELNPPSSSCKKMDDYSGKYVPCADALTTIQAGCGSFGALAHNAGMKREGHPMNFASPQMAQQYCASLGAKVAWARPWQDLAAARRLYKAVLGGCGIGDCTADKTSYMSKNYLGNELQWSGLSLGKKVAGDALAFWQVFMENLYGADTISLNAIADAPLPTGVHVDPFRASWYCYRDLPAQCP